MCSVGEIHRGDIVLMSCGTVGKVRSFWKHDDSPIAVELGVLSPLNADQAVFASVETSLAFLTATDIVDACIWFAIDDGAVKVALPPSDASLSSMYVAHAPVGGHGGDIAVS